MSTRGSTPGFASDPIHGASDAPKGRPFRPPSTGWIRRRGFWRAGPTRPTVWPTVVARLHTHLQLRTTRRLALRRVRWAGGRRVFYEEYFSGRGPRRDLLEAGDASRVNPRARTPARASADSPSQRSLNSSANGISARKTSDLTAPCQSTGTAHQGGPSMPLIIRAIRMVSSGPTRPTHPS